MEPMSARVPEGDYEAIQHFITNSSWDWRASQEGLLRVMRDELSDASGLIVVDDVPLVKEGEKSPGVARQYCGVTGGVDNCQALVDAAYALPGKERNREALAWCYGMGLYLPRAWTEDPARCRGAGIPTPARFEEKWRIGLRLVQRARASSTFRTAPSWRTRSTGTAAPSVTRCARGTSRTCSR